MNKVANGSNFYGCMADAVLNKKFDSKKQLFPAIQPAKRTYEEVKKTYPEAEPDPPEKKRLRKDADRVCVKETQIKSKFSPVKTSKKRL